MRRHAVISLALQGVGRAVVVVQGVVARQVGHTGARVAQAGQGLMGGYQLCGTQILGKITLLFSRIFTIVLPLYFDEYSHVCGHSGTICKVHLCKCSH